MGFDSIIVRRFALSIPAKITSCEQAIGRRGQRKGARAVQERRRKGVEGRSR